jgi:hypothetical protein
MTATTATPAAATTTATTATPATPAAAATRATATATTPTRPMAMTKADRELGCRGCAVLRSVSGMLFDAPDVRTSCGRDR